ncbi:DUF2975 domain-containing protein [Salmonella enterica subsp. enterica]|nr:DUF2975 domain-containing protein [Salmonella enterica subsp. enterica]
MNSKLIKLMIFMTYLLIFSLAIMNIITWFETEYHPSGLGFFLADRIRANSELYNLSIKESILGAMLSSIPIFFIMLILYYSIVLFKSVHELKIFNKKNVSILKKLSLFILLWVFIDFSIMPVTSFLFTFKNPEGERLLLISLSWGQLMGLYLSGFVFILSIILNNGLALKKDSDSII